MVIGSGDIARVLDDKKGFTFFASGVSNSQCTDVKEFEREKNLLLNQAKNNRLVYFSTLSIFTHDTPYTRHKLDMENTIKSFFPKWCIIRLGNITWGNNPNTFINYIKNNPNAEIRDEWKYICTYAEFDYWINLIPDFNCEMNITGMRKKVIECIL